MRILKQAKRHLHPANMRSWALVEAILGRKERYPDGNPYLQRQIPVRVIESRGELTTAQGITDKKGPLSRFSFAPLLTRHLYV